MTVERGEGGEIKCWFIGEAPTRCFTWHHWAGCSLAVRLTGDTAALAPITAQRGRWRNRSPRIRPTLNPASNYAVQRLFFINIWWNVICCSEVLEGRSEGGWEEGWFSLNFHTHTHSHRLIHTYIEYMQTASLFSFHILAFKCIQRIFKAV